MKRHAHTALLTTALVSLLSLGLSFAGDQESEPLEGPEWRVLGTVTGFHSAKHKKSGFEARILEADGSASVAQDPVSLYLVVTNNGTANIVERAWRIRRGVARVRGLTPSDCGVDVQVEVDRIASDGQVRGAIPKTLRLCFLSPDGKLQPHLKVSETSR
jgi:hypothetical protein